MGEKKLKLLQKYGLPVGLLLIVVMIQAFNMDLPMLSLGNLENILLQTASIGLAALGLSFIMISGEGDICFSTVFGMLAVIFSMTANKTGSFAAAFAADLGAALIVYLAIAFFVTKVQVSSFIVSITMMFMAGGVEKALHQQTTLVESESIRAFATVRFGLPLVVLIMFALYIASYIVVNKTRFGFHLRVVGENRSAGVEAGMNCTRMKIAAYIIAAFLMAMATTIESARVGAIYEQGKSYMLPIFTACYLGSSMFVPGRVNIVGTLVGTLFMGMVGNFMDLMNMSSFVISLVQGLILIVSVGISVFRDRDKIQQVKV